VSRIDDVDALKLDEPIEYINALKLDEPD